MRYKKSRSVKSNRMVVSYQKTNGTNYLADLTGGFP